MNHLGDSGQSPKWVQSEPRYTSLCYPLSLPEQGDTGQRDVQRVNDRFCETPRSPRHSKAALPHRRPSVPKSWTGLFIRIMSADVSSSRYPRTLLCEPETNKAHCQCEHKTVREAVQEHLGLAFGLASTP